VRLLRDDCTIDMRLVRLYYDCEDLKTIIQLFIVRKQFI